MSWLYEYFFAFQAYKFCFASTVSNLGKIIENDWMCILFIVYLGYTEN